MVGGVSFFKWAITVVMLIPNTRPVSRTPEPIQRHLGNLVCHVGFVRFIEVVELETMVTITATITLETTAGFAMTVNHRTFAGRTFH